MPGSAELTALVDRGDADGLNSLGIRLAEAGDIERAVRLFGAAAALGHVEAAANAGKAHNLQGDFERAMCSFRRAVEGGMSECEVGYAVALLDSGEDVEQGEMILRAAADRGSPEAAHQLALVLFVQDRLEEAREVLGPFVRGDADPAALDTYATILRFVEQYDGAVEFYDRAIEQGYVDAHLGRARTFVELEAVVEAEEAFQTAIRASVEGAVPEFACWLHQLGRPLRARQVLEDAWRDGAERPDACDVAWTQALADGEHESGHLWFRRGLAVGAPKIEARYYDEDVEEERDPHAQPPSG